ncbi:hypothetical protein L914_14980, partial [Phytophthora nicotianae]
MGDAVDDNCEWLKYHQPATDFVSETHELDELDELDDSRWSLRRQAPVTNWTKWTDGTDGGTGNRLCTAAWRLVTSSTSGAGLQRRSEFAEDCVREGRRSGRTPERLSEHRPRTLQRTS